MITIPQENFNGLKVIDLFCGAGIGAYGIKKAGFDIVWAVDNDKEAVRTYNINIGNHAICEDIRNISKDDIPKHDVMIATPVCKPFSICGVRRLTNDKKYGDLLTETMRLFFECKSKILFFENVAGIAMDESLPIFNDFVEQIENYGYHTYWSIVNSWHLGIPQERERVYLIAVRDDIPYEFEVPKTILYGRPTQLDAFADLKDKTIADVKNHNTDNYWCSRFAANFKQRPWNSPSYTVLSSQNSALFYPEPVCYLQSDDYKVKYEKYISASNENRPRRMSVREHLRLQTVGDDFYFPDDIVLQEQYNRCSGIPSLVAYKYGVAIANCLLGKNNVRRYVLKRKSLF